MVADDKTVHQTQDSLPRAHMIYDNILKQVFLDAKMMFQYCCLQYTHSNVDGTSPNGHLCFRCMIQSQI